MLKMGCINKRFGWCKLCLSLLCFYVLCSFHISSLLLNALPVQAHSDTNVAASRLSAVWDVCDKYTEVHTSRSLAWCESIMGSVRPCSLTGGVLKHKEQIVLHSQTSLSPCLHSLSSALWSKHKVTYLLSSPFVLEEKLCWVKKTYRGLYFSMPSLLCCFISTETQTLIWFNRKKKPLRCLFMICVCSRLAWVLRISTIHCTSFI